MKDTNLKINISFKNDQHDFEIYQFIQAQRDKSNFIKNLIKIEMLRQSSKDTISNSEP